MSGLGKGLSSLIPDNMKRRQPGSPLPPPPANLPSDGTTVIPVLSAPGEAVIQIPVERIKSNRYQPRHSFNHSELEDLARSIKEHGILQPLVLTAEAGGGYELIAGERRLRAAKILELKTVPAIIRQAADQQKLELALIENIQRQDLNLIEEAVAYKQLIDEFSLNHDDVARRVGKSRAVVTNAIRLLGLPPDIKDAVMEGKISPSHARSIAALDDPKDQIDLFHRIVSEHLNVREVEDHARKVVVAKHIRRVNFDPIVDDMVEHLRSALGTKVAIKKKGERGTILINFFSEEELNNIVKKISEA